MAGTRIGGAKAAQAIKKKYGSDYYVKIGKIGGRLGTTGGFASPLEGVDGLTGRQRASKAGVIGGRKSRR